MTDNQQPVAEVSKVKEPKGSAKKEYLIKIEKDIQKYWEDNHINEADASDENKEKFFVTFPYPYMNGRLHLGHGFSLTKAEFQARFQKLLGKNVLFPFGFHCTGMPIAACADKLKREIEDYGLPPVFPEKKETNEEEDDEETEVKTGDYQWNIMIKNGLNPEDIPKFSNAKYWLEYFPPLAEQDLKNFGVMCDFRRSFITTDINPYYDSFIRWQFNRLKEQGKISFGKRFSIFSPKDNQLCADHDRATGEGSKPVEYTIIKLFLKKPYPAVLKNLENREIYLGAATFRPETMFGQTNCWLLPEGEYGAFETNNGELIVCTARAARNLAYQGYGPEWGKVVQVAKFHGSDLMGAALKAPLTPFETVYVLPMMSISTKKTTGVVTSVPSDAPADYAALIDLKKKPELREKYGIKEEQLFEPVPIIEVPEFGNMCAPVLYEKHKIKSQNDKDLLEKAKDEAYLSGFNKGVMIVEGEFNGVLVRDAKPKIRQMLIDQGLAIPYGEPEKEVISRSGDKCVVSLTDQWYLDYGEEEWKKIVENHLKNNFHVYNIATLNELNTTVDWLREWGCSRSYGLGTKLPWDTQFLIESLSDSTIYMAFYTVAHLLQGGVLDGSKPGPLSIKPEQLNDEVWSYIFYGTEPSNTNDISKEALDKLRKEFLYWYPVDLRVSGKDLIKNHLTMFLYNHAAIFPDKMPKSIFANGYVMVDGKKMSKSAGNFLTLSKANEDYGADATRFALCESGDTHDDANFERNNANSAVLKLKAYLEWVEEVLKTKTVPLRDETSEYIFADKVLDARINVCVLESKKNYETMVFREVLKTAWVEMQDALAKYRETMQRDNEKMHKKLILKFIEVQAIIMSPIIPHTSEYIWGKLLNNNGSIVNAKWPEIVEIDETTLLSDEYLREALHTFRQAFQKESKSKKDKKVQKVYVYVADKYLDWQLKSLELLSKYKDDILNPKIVEKPKVSEENGAKTKPTKEETTEDIAMKSISQELGPFMKFKPMPFVAAKRDQLKKDGEKALSPNLPFNEFELLKSNINLIKACFGDASNVEICSLSGSYQDPLKKANRAQPLEPSIAVVWEK
ncbi:hypothetical protein ABK040_009164 [Willaertia magna]